MTGQDSPIVESYDSCPCKSERTHHLTDLLGKLKNYLIQLPKADDHRIIDVLKDISNLEADTQDQLSSTYLLLVKKTQDDFCQFREVIEESTTKGYPTLLLTLKSLLLAYQVGISKNAKQAIADINGTSTDLLTMLQTAHSQAKRYRETLDHAAKTWNSVTSAFTNYIEVVEAKALHMSSPAASKFVRARSPVSTDSRSNISHYKEKPGIYTQGKSYRSEMGILQTGLNGEISFVPSSNEGAQISSIFNSSIPWKVITVLMNLNLKELSLFFSNDPEYLMGYELLVKEKRADLIKSLMEKIPRKHGQWVELK